MKRKAFKTGRLERKRSQL